MTIHATSTHEGKPASQEQLDDLGPAHRIIAAIAISGALWLASVAYLLHEAIVL